MIGPDIPAHLVQKAAQEAATTTQREDDESSDDDDYGPALPPDMVAPPKATARPVAGPSFPQGPPPARAGDDESEEEDYGPMPLRAGERRAERSGVEEFLEQEERRRRAIEEDGKPKALKREEWMLAPPDASSSGVLGSLDSKGRLRARQFQRSAEEKVTDRTLWTETPAERQQRLAEEVSGKRKRAEVGAGAGLQFEEMGEEERRKRRKDAEIERGIREHNKKTRGESLLEKHVKSGAAQAATDAEKDKAKAIWDRERDMGLGGRLMDERSRQNLIKDAKGLGSRFGHSKSGHYM